MNNPPHSPAYSLRQAPPRGAPGVPAMSNSMQTVAVATTMVDLACGRTADGSFGSPPAPSHRPVAHEVTVLDAMRNRIAELEKDNEAIFARLAALEAAGSAKGT